MKIIYGLLFMVTGVVILLVQSGLITLMWPFIWPILLILFGLYIVLTSQRKIVEQRMQKKAAKNEAKLEKKHQKETSKLEKVVEKKDAVIEKVKQKKEQTSE